MSAHLSNAIQRFAAEEHIFEQEHDADGGSDPAASIGRREVGAEKLCEPHPFEKSIDDGQRADAVRVQGFSPGASELTWARVTGRTANMAFFGFFHGCIS